MIDEVIYELVELNRLDAALDVLFNNVDSWLIAGDVDRAREFLKTLDVDRLGLTLVIGVLTITLPIKNVSERQRFVEYVEKNAPARAESLLRGLRS